MLILSWLYFYGTIILLLSNSSEIMLRFKWYQYKICDKQGVKTAGYLRLKCFLNIYFMKRP